MNEALISFFATSLALISVLLLAYFVLKGGAKISRRHHGNGLTSVVEVTPLGGRDKLVVVNYQSTKLLLGVSNGGIQLLHTETLPQDSTLLPEHNR